MGIFHPVKQFRFSPNLFFRVRKGLLSSQIEETYLENTVVGVPLS